MNRSDYLAAFDATSSKPYPGEAEYEIERDGEELTLSLPASDDAVDSAAIDAARSLLPHLDALDAQATAYLRATPGWPYGDDALLWLLIVEPDNVRFCYRQASVNDEQVIGFARSAGGWTLTGPDPRFRGNGAP